MRFIKVTSMWRNELTVLNTDYINRVEPNPNSEGGCIIYVHSPDVDWKLPVKESMYDVMEMANADTSKSRININ